MLKHDVERYVALRKATGFKFRDSEAMLLSFATYAEARGDDVVRAETAVAWAGQSKSSRRSHERLRVVTRFAQFLRAEDPRHEVPPEGVFRPQAVRPSPHIYSEEDIARIVTYAAKLGPEGSLRPLTYSTVFGLMAVAGLRRNEAIELRIGRTVAGARPRLHDLRHTFAVRALERCPAGRDAVNRHMLALTTYMGHARVESTYWYLERTPQMLRDIADACEALVTGGDA